MNILLDILIGEKNNENWLVSQFIDADTVAQQGAIMLYDWLASKNRNGKIGLFILNYINVSWCTFIVSGQWRFVFAICFWWISKKDFSLSASDGFLAFRIWWISRKATFTWSVPSLNWEVKWPCSLHFAWEFHTQWWLPCHIISYWHFVKLKQIN